jgi:glycosyltransferase involved in cell wall biosynthesis
MISIVTGTLNRKNLLPSLIQNTVDSDERLELVLVDGGSTDGTIEYIKELNHNKIKLIEVGGRSSYPHYMNLGIENSSYELVCQWNDDALLVDSWEDVFKEIEDGIDFYLFNWKYGNLDDITNEDWITGRYHENQNNKGWCICDEYDTIEEVVMNYGIYRKNIFREIGMYHPEFNYYYADGDMSRRSYLFGYKYKALKHIKVCSINTEKRAFYASTDSTLYHNLHEEYKNKILNKEIPLLK